MPSSSGAIQFPYHFDVESYRRRIFVAGGTISTPALSGLDSFVRWAYANNLRDVSGANHRVKWLWVPATDNFSGCLENLWFPTGLSACINNGFTATNYSLINGLTGNGSAYLNTGFTPSAHLFGNDAHFSFYCRSNDGQQDSFGVSLGFDNNVPRFLIHPKWVDGNTYMDWLLWVQTRITTTNPSILGLVSLNVVTNSLRQTWVKASQTGSDTRATFETVSGVTHPMFLFASNGTGTPNLFSTRSVGGASIGNAIPDTLMSEYSNRWQTLCSAIHPSRSV